MDENDTITPEAEKKPRRTPPRRRSTPADSPAEAPRLAEWLRIFPLDRIVFAMAYRLADAPSKKTGIYYDQIATVLLPIGATGAYIDGAQILRARFKDGSEEWDLYLPNGRFSRRLVSNNNDTTVEKDFTTFRALVVKRFEDWRESELKRGAPPVGPTPKSGIKIDNARLGIQ